MNRNKRARRAKVVMLTLGYAIANPLELDRRLLPIGGREFEAEVSHGGEIITIWRYDDVNESTYGWAGPCGQNEEVLDSLLECLEDCRAALSEAEGVEEWCRDGF